MAFGLHAARHASQNPCIMLRHHTVFLTLVLAAVHCVPALARCPADATTAAFLAPGPYAVGVRSLTFVDSTRPTPPHAGFPALPSRTLPTQVWYPATGPAGAAPVADSPLASGGPFPFIVNSHGFGDLNSGEAYLAIALARRGFVVASPSFPLTNTGTPGGPYLTDAANQPADVRFVIDQVLALSGGNGWLAGGVDRKRIGAQGLSLGGLTTLLVTYTPTLRDRRIRAAFAMAPASCELGRKTLAPAPPLLLIDGDQDLITPIDQNAGRTFLRGRMPRTLATLARATHTAFTGLISADSAVSYDASLGCSFVSSITQQQVDDLIAAFGPAAAGTDTTGCDLPCKGAVPANAPMPATRQHDLTQAAGTAFFQERFQKSRAAHCFLRKVFAQENPEVTIARRGGASAP
jgi:predicted dienelactone hydrolase